MLGFQKRARKAQIANARNKKRDIITNPVDIKS
jgi:hypothetical protein